MRKLNLSFPRILGRLTLTFIIGILFGIAMFPFLQTSDGLLFEQRAAIGNENILRMVMLWGLYTVLVTLFTFWKKRFRMVSVLLLACWVISIIFLVIINFLPDQQKRCLRSSPYSNTPEINRALDLIAQRLDVENNRDTYIGLAFNFRNCLNIQYSNDVKSVEAEGVFLPEDSDWQNMQILLSPSYKNFDDLTIATILIHELSHVGQKVFEDINNKKIDCYSNEAEAFTVQSILISHLNQEEIRSINTRLQENIRLNPAFRIVLSVEGKRGESYNACLQLKKENSLTDTQFNECVWTGVRNKVEQEVKNDKFYQTQCLNQ